ncbi:MAG: YhbY family RNA-binding protein [Betaproteobacteria bacterium]|nr:YhbY family RNA-binding protein [Betaproteobacteria bacterium]
MKIILTPTERQALKARAHALQPVVMIGDQGLTPAVLTEIERSLKAHELIKIRAMTDDREQRKTWFDEISDSLNAAPVQHIGKIFIVWRENPEKTAAQVKPKKKPVRLTKRQEEAKYAAPPRQRRRQA